MTTVLIACIAAIAATALLAVAFLVVRRSRRHGEGRVVDAVTVINDRMEAMVSELSNALERVQEEHRRSRVLGELGGSIDLDEVLTRTLEATGALPGVHAALVSVEGGAMPPIASALGMSLDEAGPPPVGAPPDGSIPRSISISYTYDAGQETGLTPLIRTGLVVPLASEGEHIGYLAAYSRSGAQELDPAGRKELEELALRAGPAIENARRFREARQLADLDALTGLHNRRYFHETLAREVARAQRYSRHLALIVLDLDDFKAINDRIGHLAGDDVLAAAAERVRDVVRTADIACRVGGDEFAVILPESGLGDADQLYRRLEEAVSSRPVGQAGRLHISAGVTELRPDDDAITFFQRADEALYRAKGAGKGTVVAVAADAAPTAAPPPGNWPRSAPGANAS
jgi:diguanylate cyclase (GGDEF)-like protein